MAAQVADTVHLSSAEALTEARIAPLVKEALRRWSLMEGEGFAEALANVDIQITRNNFV